MREAPNTTTLPVAAGPGSALPLVNSALDMVLKYNADGKMFWR